jgi:anti-sigma factor RsiW
MTETWHADDDLLALYVRGDAGALRGTSLEQHLTHCASCRARIARHVETDPLELVWSRIQEQAQAPQPTRIERMLIRLGVSEPDALLVAVSPSLRASWLFGLVITLSFVGLAAAYGGDRGLAFFLIVAPLVPVAGVAFAYGPDVDPSYEVGAAAPYSAARLLLLRSAAVLATSLPLALLATLLIPSLSWSTVSWLLPALAFTAMLLAASTWVRPSYASVGLGVAWACAVGSATVDQDPAAVLGPALLVVYAAFGVIAAFVFRLRIRHLTLLGSLS